MPISSGLPYDELVFHVDLCVLTYALYTQSLLWPFDPYYEGMASKGSSRRDNTMTAIRTWAAAGPAAGRNNYHGPGGAQGWPTNNFQDPVMYRYDKVKPWLPAACCPEKKWILYDLPPALIGPVAAVRVCQYGASPAHPDPNLLAGTPQLGVAIPNPHPAAGGADVVYCFEGGTGGQPGVPASWSLMGLVLERQKANGHYDVHVAFRGSRSGSGGRALAKGAFQGKGNPDWVTDMDFATMVADPVFGGHGSLSRGFSHAVKTCLPSIIACLQAVQNNHNAPAARPPDNIWITGHSLGGALATHFAAAMVVGTTYGLNGQGAAMPAALHAWPWDRTKLISVSAPKCAGKSFHRNFNSKVYCRRVVLDSDPITKDPPRISAGRHAVTRLDLHHVGTEVYVTAETTVGHAIAGAAGLAFGDHEPKAIRQRLIRKLAQWGDIHPDGASYAHDPWNEYASFNSMGGHAVLTAAVISGHILSGFDVLAANYLDVFSEVMGANGAYATFIRDSVATERRNAVTAAKARIGITQGKVWTRARDDLAETVTGVRAHYPTDEGKYLGKILILAELARNPGLYLSHLANSVAVMECL